MPIELQNRSTASARSRRPVIRPFHSLPTACTTTEGVILLETLS